MFVSLVNGANEARPEKGFLSWRIGFKLRFNYLTWSLRLLNCQKAKFFILDILFLWSFRKKRWRPFLWNLTEMTPLLWIASNGTLFVMWTRGYNICFFPCFCLDHPFSKAVNVSESFWTTRFYHNYDTSFSKPLPQCFYYQLSSLCVTYFLKHKAKNYQIKLSSFTTWNHR